MKSSRQAFSAPDAARRASSEELVYGAPCSCDGTAGGPIKGGFRDVDSSVWEKMLISLMTLNGKAFLSKKVSYRADLQ